MRPSKPRPVPRPFEMPWASGQIVEEAAAVGQHHEPAVQLLEYEDGSWSIRFAFYKEGRFQRAPLMLNDDEISPLHEALNETPRLKALLKQLIE